MKSKQKVIIITGPTASGKTHYAVDLAKEIGGEIISADSRQVFRDMTLGTGKDLDEYGDVPYHLIDILEAGTDFSVSLFQQEVLKILTEIIQRGNVPIICGGTGHYIKSLIEDYKFDSAGTDKELTEELEHKSREELYQMIKDQGLWETHHWEKDSKRRMARALEKKGQEKIDVSSTENFSDLYDAKIFYTNVERSLLRDKIRIRLEERIKLGMIEEVYNLMRQRNLSRERLERYGLEYRWVARYLDNEIDYNQMVEKLAIDIGRFAKRQMTFIRYLEKCGHQLAPINSFEGLLEQINSWLKGKEEI